ncbi:hypothetical protein Mal64_35570 [Pseudobythopirellula maris]|uniref:Chromosome partition protein Smc n=1 Tax=Pseudobythopirellula maris TaxID=2527991 RepID=A0A5C5ZHS1_9BACT|nr:hypothetical protein [Pseudobythopirellula maris]TWT86728.1 hypothetical protein Mal64_35570 [Pseudobythopirellula maris]
MSDYTIYDSEQELRERIDDLNDLLSDYEKTQAVLDEQRGVFADQVQGALAIYERQVSDYERKRDDLDRRQGELTKGRSDALENREALRHQLDAKRGKKATDNAGPKAGGADRGAGQADGAAHTTGPTTREQIDNLKAELSQPRPALAHEPPGMGGSQASEIDKDLKMMAKIKEKEQKMDGASKKLKDDWSLSKGPKR